MGRGRCANHFCHRFDDDILVRMVHHARGLTTILRDHAALVDHGAVRDDMLELSAVLLRALSDQWHAEQEQQPRQQTQASSQPQLQPVQQPQPPPLQQPQAQPKLGPSPMHLRVLGINGATAAPQPQEQPQMPVPQPQPQPQRQRQPQPQPQQQPKPQATPPRLTSLSWQPESEPTSARSSLYFI